jgi:3-oxoacyl-[acyl-carrier protein] reductase
MISFDFSGKSVLVTSASSGIGNAIACAFRDAGATVHGTGTKPQQAYASDLDNIAYHQANAGEDAAMAWLAAALPTLGVLVNNAGMVMYKRGEYEIENFRQVLDVNLPAMMTLSGALRPKLALSGSGPTGGASKAAIIQLTKTLAVAWARDGIRVNAIDSARQSPSPDHAFVSANSRWPYQRAHELVDCE